MSADKAAQDAKPSETEAAVTQCGPNTTFSYRDRKDDNEPSYTCQVPANVHWIHMVVAGGPGGYASDQPGYESGGPGKNSVIAASVAVVPNEILSIYVGDGGRHSPDARSGYAPGGHGGAAPQATASQGGGGGGSSAVVGSVSGMLIHAGGGGGAGGAGVAGNGGSGGHGGLKPADGTNGGGKGGQGGAGGDQKFPDRSGNGHGGDRTQAGGGGGGGGGGNFGGEGGGFNALGGGGGGGGGGSSYVARSSTDVVEGNPFTGKPGHVVFNSFR